VKLIVCSGLPISRLFGEKIDAWWFGNNGFDVEFWDLAPLFYPVEKLKGFYSGDPNYCYFGPAHRVVSSYDELLDVARANSGALVWYLSRFDRMIQDDAVIALFNQHGIAYIFQHFDPHDSCGSWSDYVKWPYREMREWWFSRRCNPRAVVTSGTLGRSQVKARYPKAQVISVPSVKVLWAEKGLASGGDYAVFVDESVGFEPDLQILGNVSCTDVNGYYKRMRDLFCVVEDSLQVPVKVACSEKYRYPDPEGSFGHRDIVYGETFRLIQGCEMAFGHLSLALDQAVISRKPVVLVDDISFSAWRRKFFRDVVSRFRQQPVLNTKINKILIEKALVRNLAFYETVEAKYFREPAVREEYRRICADAFRMIAA